MAIRRADQARAALKNEPQNSQSFLRGRLELDILHPLLQDKDQQQCGRRWSRCDKILGKTAFTVSNGSDTCGGAKMRT